MNMHIAQSILTETELRLLAATPYQIVNPGSNKPIIGIFQDSLLGSFRFTRPDIRFTPLQAMDLLASYPHVDVNQLEHAYKEKGYVTNFDILSQIMPPISLKYKTALYDEDEDPKTSNNILEIQNGRFIRGQLDKGCFESASKGILHRVCNDYGNMACADFNDHIQAIVTEFMKTSSFSVGISDLIANAETNEKISVKIQEQKMQVQTLIDKIHMGIFENNTANSNMEHFELMVSNILNKATEEAGKIGKKSLNKDNRFLMIVNSGSKGSLINISQMLSCLGQTTVDGKRISYGFEDRTLPHFKKFDDSPFSRGFIENSYISGLTAPELFFHAMAGRTGLIDTAVKTSQTGYIQRRLVKGLEDLIVKYDMTVRNNKDKIIQFSYGEDNFDSMKVENQSLPIIEMGMEEIYMHYDIPGLSTKASTADMNLLQSIFSKTTMTRFKKQIPKLKEKVHSYIQNLIQHQEDIIVGVFKRQKESGVRMPVAFQYLIGNIQGQLELRENSAVDITPLEAFELIERYFEKINSIQYAMANPLFEVLYFYYLNPRDLLLKRRFHQKGLTLLLETILLKYKEALIHPGEMVGVVAAQSIGEPATQLTLNSVNYETEILVRDQQGKIQKVQIGDFIENEIMESKKVEYMQEKDTTYAELDKDTHYFEIPSATQDGQTVWKRIEAVTRHPVVNEDGTNTMLKITTKGCREVMVTKAKSVLQLIDGKIQPVYGSSVKVGDYFPISKVTTAEQIKLDNEIKFPIEISNRIPNKVNGQLVFEDRQERMPDLEFDPIVSIEEVPNTTNYAYDLTVKDTRNFDTYNGLCCRDTFHSSGISSKSNVTRGVPRIEEILRLTKNPKNPSMTVYMKPYDQEKQESAVKIASFMKHTKLVDVVKSVQICFDPIEEYSQIEEDRAILDEFYGFERMLQRCIDGDIKDCTEEDLNTCRTSNTTDDKSKWIIRMEMDQDTLLENNISMDDIHFAITHSDYGSNVQCVFTDYNADKLVFRIRTNAAIFQKASQKGFANPLDQTDKIYILKNFQDAMMNNIVLRGINHIQNVLPRKVQNSVVKDEAKYVKREIWVLDTTGSNLLDTLALDFIDYKRTYSNDIKEVFDVLGIEAARQIIHNELVEVMEFSGASINYHHTSLLCDRMTCNKDMVSIFRSGLLNDNVGPIAKATFEVHTEVFLNAARHGEFDHMRGVSANIMCGQQGLYGTNAFQILLDMKAMESVVAPRHEPYDVEKDIERAFEKKAEEGDKCENIAIENNIVNIKRPIEDVMECFDDKYDIGF